jgi:NAD(P) transhydrogenase subunit alpha
MKSSTLLISLPLLAIFTLLTIAWSQALAQKLPDSPSDGSTPGVQQTNSAPEKTPPKKDPEDAEQKKPVATGSGAKMGVDMMTSLTVFVLAIFVGFEVVTKVPPTLHTPLMSGSNAISGITVVGAVIVAGSATGGVSSFLGFLAVLLATINVVGGFLVTHRMLAMFQKR